MIAAAKHARKRYLSLAVLVLGTSSLLLVVPPQEAPAQQSRRFNTTDDIGLFHISITPTFSPDDRYFVIVADRGRLDLNRAESSLRVYRTEDVNRFLSHPEIVGEPAPVWIVNKSTYKDGPIITGIRWLTDSSGVAFLSKTSSGNDQLLLANIRAKSVQPLTSEDQDVTAFDIMNSRQFVYTVLSPAMGERDAKESQAAEIPAAGRSLDSLIFHEGNRKPNIWIHDLSELWAVTDEKRFPVVDASSSHAIPIHLEGQRAMALSPDGHTVVTALTVKELTPEWERLFLPPVPTSPYRIRRGTQNPDAFSGQRDVSEYVLIDLSNGRTKSLTHAPLGNGLGWWGMSRAAWSTDGGRVVLSDTFLLATEHTPPPRMQDTPCVAVAELATGTFDCLERIMPRPASGKDGGWRLVSDVHFGRGNNEVIVQYVGVDGGDTKSTTYVRGPGDSWRAAPIRDSGSKGGPSIDVFVREQLNEPPVLVATDKRTKTSRVIWDPNPQLKDVRMGEVSVFKWQDNTGRNWVGGLYKPPDYVQGKRFPLVIQTHGFDEHEFRAAGAFPTAFAAQELAAVGFVVLQVRDCPVRTNPEEGPCQVAGYEAAVQQLVKDGQVDPDRIGVIGFSRTCYYVLEALTRSSVNFRAASITDGINGGYLDYVVNVDRTRNALAHEYDAMIGARPFANGLQQWLKRSPEFNMDRVTAPLLVVAIGRSSVLEMWEPYAVLRYLNKPVDLIILNSDEHILTNPAARLASQGSTVDWFRFWLKNEEDGDPAKAEQYARWRELRKLQQANVAAARAN